MTDSTSKKSLREEIRKRLAAVPPAVLAERSTRACLRLTREPEYRRAAALMTFLSTPQEVDTSALALHAWAHEKRVYAPQVSWEQRRMIPMEIRSLSSAHVREGQMGLREPIDGQTVPISEIDLVIVPGLAFDEHGNRLGRGRGFYDRFLSHREFRGVSCALALEEQVVPSVPHDELDRAVQMLVTDLRVLRFAAQPKP